MNKLNFKSIAIRIWKPVIGILALFVIVIWTTGILKSRVQPDVLPHQPGIALPRDAEVLEIHKQDIPTVLEIMGTVTSEDKIPLSARISAFVEVVQVSAGDRVDNRQILIRLDDRELKQQLAEAEANTRNAESEYLRTKRLVESDAATQQQLIKTQSAFESARARVDQIKVMLTYTEIRSPIQGIVTDRLTEPGMLINPGQPVLSVYNPEAMRLDVPVPVRLISRLSTGLSVTVKHDTQQNPIGGTVSEIVSEVDSRSRTQLVKVRLNAADDQLVPGSFGRLLIETDPHKGYMIPTSAVLRVGQLEMVHAIRNGRAFRQLVKTGPISKDMIEVLSGIQDGESILVHPIESQAQ